MNRQNHLRSVRALAALLALSPLSLSAATLYWDTNGAPSGLGGAASWAEGAGNWSTDTSGTLPTVWTSASRDTADFRGTAGTVTVGSGVSSAALIFNVGGYTVSGGDITLGRSSGTGNITVVNYAAGTGANLISSNLIIDDAGTAAGAANYTINSTGTGGLTLGGNLTLNYASGTPSGNKAIVIQTGSSASSVTLNGSIASGANGGGASLLGLVFGQGGSSQSNALALNGTFNVNGNNSGVGRGTTINGGTVIVGHNSALGTGTVTFGSSGARGDMKLLTDGTRAIANNLTVSGASTSQTYIGGNTAHDSTFSGGVNINAFGTNGTPGVISTPDPIFTAASGGRVNFTGVVAVTAGIPRGIVKKGAGVVAFGSLTGNTYKGFTKVDEGTLLLMNTSGSATGDGSQLTPGTAGVIVAAGARLGGTGFSTVKASATGATSVFTPGNMTKEGVSSLGTLTLSGGLFAASGATFDFDINGSSSDQLSFGAGALDIDGVVTVNFTSLGTVLTNTTYTLFTGSGDWSSVSASFVFDAPEGYSLSSTFGGGAGYVFDASGHSLTVQFSAIPEPSVFALLGGAGALLIAGSRRRRAS